MFRSVDVEVFSRWVRRASWLLAIGFTALAAGSGPATPRLLTPPDAPDTIAGPDTLFPNQSGLFTVTATDPDTDSLYIIVFPDMADTARNVVFGPLPSGTPMVFGMAYDSNATFTMRARTRDIGGASSPLSPAKKIVVSPARIAWQFQTPDHDAFYSSTAIDFATGDTIVYCGCDNSVIYAFNARTGALKGAFTSLNQDAFSSSPVISTDGQRVYVADDGGWLYSLSANNLNLLSHYPPNDTWVPGMTPFFSTPAVSGNQLYVGRDDGYFYQFADTTGVLMYRSSYNTRADISSSPAVNAAGDRIVVANDSGRVFCFNDTAALDLVWSRLLGGPVASSPAITPGGTVYCGCDDQILHAASLVDGSPVGPQFMASDFITSSPIVDAAGNVYFCVDNGTVYCVNNGIEVWHRIVPYGENTSGTCCLAPDSTLLVNTDNGSLYALDIRPSATGPGSVVYRIVWPEPNAGSGRRKSASLPSSPSVGPGNGLFYAGSTYGGFFAVRTSRPGFPNGRLPDAPWPKFHHDIQNRGALPFLTGIGGQSRIPLDAPMPSATVVRGVLFVPQNAPRNLPTSMKLLDVSGRSVARLHAGANDVSGLAPGVYFMASDKTERPVKVAILR